MTEFTLVEGKAYHCGQLIRQLRVDHWRAVVMAEVGHRDLRKDFDNSYFRRAWLIDGKLGALGGVTGSPLDTNGFVWLGLTMLGTKYPRDVVRTAREMIEELLQTKHSLTTIIMDGDAAALRFATFLGFRPADMPSLLGRRLVATKAAANPDIRVSLGSTYGMVMHCTGEG